MSSTKRKKSSDPEPRDMSQEFCCYFCAYSDPSRTSGDKIRCTRFSTWVNPHTSDCKDGISRADKQFYDTMNDQLKNVIVKPTGKHYNYSSRRDNDGKS